MAIRLSGMTSGLDTDSIVKAMVSSYTTRKEKYQKAQTKLEWTQDAWKSLNTKVYSLYSNISNLDFYSIQLKEDISFGYYQGHSKGRLRCTKRHTVAENQADGKGRIYDRSRN